MEYVIGILLLISFVGLAVYAVRGGNLMMGMLIMGIIWTALPLIGNTFATNPELSLPIPASPISPLSLPSQRSSSQVLRDGEACW